MKISGADVLLILLSVFAWTALITFLYELG